MISTTARFKEIKKKGTLLSGPSHTTPPLCLLFFCIQSWTSHNANVDVCEFGPPSASENIYK